MVATKFKVSVCLTLDYEGAGSPEEMSLGTELSQQEAVATGSGYYEEA